MIGYANFAIFTMSAVEPLQKLRVGFIPKFVIAHVRLRLAVEVAHYRGHEVGPILEISGRRCAAHSAVPLEAGALVGGSPLRRDGEGDGEIRRVSVVHQPVLLRRSHIVVVSRPGVDALGPLDGSPREGRRMPQHPERDFWIVVGGDGGHAEKAGHNR
jgi:hypothetical protein